MIEAINSEMDKMIEADFIEPSKSPFAAPTVCVKKKTILFVLPLISGWLTKTLSTMHTLCIESMIS